MNKKALITLAVFLIGIIISGLTVYHIVLHNGMDIREKALLNATAYGERIENEIYNGISITADLQQALIASDGKTDKFNTIAENLMNDYVESIQLAPNGVVTDIYPAGNDAGKIDLINDKERGKISRYARDNNVLITQGPFDLKQGGKGIAVRNPLYLKDKNGNNYFWGFTIVILKIPKLFSSSIKDLSKLGYEYSLLKTASPWDDTYKVVYGSKSALEDPAHFTFSIGEEKWKLNVRPTTGWIDKTFTIKASIYMAVVILLLTGLTYALLTYRENKIKFQSLATIDALTEISNRYGFEESSEQLLSKNQNTDCIFVLLDIDNFKSVNDVYGHAYGDRALKSLAQSMKEFFPSDAIVGRNGGDEFCALIPNWTSEDACEKLEQFTKMPKSFSYKGEKHEFFISLGYAEFPRHGDKYSKLLRCADTALYQVKLHGKNGCLEYSDDLQSGVRKQLGFALKDISENLPGAFIIYRADKSDDELFYANQEFLSMAGYKSVDELFALTDKSFRNLIREDERARTEASIWEQIDSGSVNDYIEYHLRKADGSYLSVLDHGRIVDGTQYGRVFYVLFMDLEEMNVHFSSFETK